MSTLQAGTLNVTGALNLPNYTTTQRDALSSPATGTIIFNTTDGVIEIYDGTEWTATAGAASYIVATGGATSTSGDYKIHTFNAGGSFNVASVSSDAANNKLDYMVVAGGGGGGGFASGNFNNFGSGGGGGAGGILKSAGFNFTATAGTYPVGVGGGGSGGVGNNAGSDGGGSQFGPFSS